METDDAKTVFASVAEPELFEGVFDRHHSAVWAFLSRRDGRACADDLAGEVFLIAFARRASYDPSCGAVRSWLYGIAANLLHRRYRSEARAARAFARTWARQVPAVPPTDTAVDRRAGQDDLRRVPDGLTRLAAADRGVRALFVWSNCPTRRSPRCSGWRSARCVPGCRVPAPGCENSPASAAKCRRFDQEDVYELDLMTYLRDDQGPFAGAATSTATPAQPGQYVVHWARAGGSIEARWPADPSTLALPRAALPFGGASSDMTLTTCTPATRCRAGPLRLASGSCQTFEVSVVEADSRQAVAVTVQVRTSLPGGGATLGPDQPTALISGATTTDQLPEVGGPGACGGLANRHGTIAAGPTFSTPADALGAFLASMPSLLPSGYLQVTRTDGTIAFVGHARAATLSSR